jgi:hypothetical protein
VTEQVILVQLARLMPLLREVEPAFPLETEGYDSLVRGDLDLDDASQDLIHYYFNQLFDTAEANNVPQLRKLIDNGIPAVLQGIYENAGGQGLLQNHPRYYTYIDPVIASFLHAPSVGSLYTVLHDQLGDLAMLARQVAQEPQQQLEGKLDDDEFLDQDLQQALEMSMTRPENNNNSEVDGGDYGDEYLDNSFDYNNEPLPE